METAYIQVNTGSRMLQAKEVLTAPISIFCCHESANNEQTQLHTVLSIRSKWKVFLVDQLTYPEHLNYYNKRKKQKINCLLRIFSVFIKLQAGFNIVLVSKENELCKFTFIEEKKSATKYTLFKLIISRKLQKQCITILSAVLCISIFKYNRI